MRNFQRVCVYCGSHDGNLAVFREGAERLGRLLAERRIGLVYGGGNVGLMGRIADAVLAGGGHVLGVIPRDLRERELAHGGATELVVVESMHERKARM
ncbi:MAG: LOG family protein, partial [Planctomycetota bacterium]